MIMLATLKCMEIELVDLELSASIIIQVENLVGTWWKQGPYIDSIHIIPVKDIYVKSMEIELVDLELWIHYYNVEIDQDY